MEENYGNLRRKKYQKVLIFLPAYFSLIFAKIVAIRNVLSGDTKMLAEITKFSNARFTNIPENLSHIFDANLKRFLPEWKFYISIKKIMEKLSQFLPEIPGVDRA